MRSRNPRACRERFFRTCLIIAAVSCLLAGCAEFLPSPDTGTGRSAPQAVKLEPGQAQRVSGIMMPLVNNMSRPIPPQQVKVGVFNSPSINAANAGGGQFYVTTGLLQKANDEQLRGVLAHEVAHEDLGHVAKAQARGTGLQIGTVILDQIFPGSGAITPIIADIGVMRPYSRREEYEADARAVDILNRAGFDGKKIVIDMLSWILQTSGPSGGDFLSTHPGTEDRIQRIRAMK